MKKFKLLLWLLVLGLIALLVYQNLEFLKIRHTLTLNLGIRQFSTELNLGVMLVGLFIAGFLIAYFFSLTHRFKSRKTIRRLNEELAGERKKTSAIQSGQGDDSRQAAAAGPGSGKPAGEAGASGEKSDTA